MWKNTPKKSFYVNLLDIGTSKIRCVIEKKKKGQAPEILGLSTCPAKGIQNGAIIGLEKATECISLALKEAEEQANRQIETVFVNVSSTGLKSCYLQADMDFETPQPVTPIHLKKLVEQALETIDTKQEEILHAIPLNYVLDQENTPEPLGLIGKHLTVQLHLVTIPRGTLTNLITVLDRCHVTIEEKVATPYAAALASATPDEKEIGCSVIDFGAGATHIAHFMKGIFVGLHTIDLGGNTLTRGIAQQLNCSLPTAEKIKLSYGSLFSFLGDIDEHFFVPIVGEQEEVQVSKRDLSALLNQGIDELLTQISQTISGSEKGALRWILTGGGSRLEGLSEKISETQGRSTRLCTTRFPHLPEGVDEKTFSTCNGLLSYAIMKHQEAQIPTAIQKKKKKPSFLKKVWTWIIRNF